MALLRLVLRLESVKDGGTNEQVGERAHDQRQSTHILLLHSSARPRPGPRRVAVRLSSRAVVAASPCPGGPCRRSARVVGGRPGTLKQLPVSSATWRTRRHLADAVTGWSRRRRRILAGVDAIFRTGRSNGLNHSDIGHCIHSVYHRSSQNEAGGCVVTVDGRNARDDPPGAYRCNATRRVLEYGWRILNRLS